jgi:phytoene dehydrogenase-like protein
VNVASHNAVVIGGGLAGLVSAIYLAKAQRSVLLLEADTALGARSRLPSSVSGMRPVLHSPAMFALDPRMIRELNLARRGLKFSVRDMPLVSLGQDRRPLIISRDVHETVNAIASHSSADSAAFRQFHRETFSLARSLRPLWWEDGGALPAGRSQRMLVAQLKAASASAILTGWFESEALRAALAFDSADPLTAGSALSIVWRASQEMCGLQGAVAMPRGGPQIITTLLTACAQDAGVEIRTRARVARLLLAGNEIAGVELDSSEQLFAPVVLSTLSRHETLVRLAPTASAGFGETLKLRDSQSSLASVSVVFQLNAAPMLGGSDVPQMGRFIVADRLESYAATADSARGHRLPDEIVMEAVVPTAADPALAPPGQHLLYVRVPALPMNPKGGWTAMSAKLVERIVATLQKHSPQLRARIVGIDLYLPDSSAAASTFSSGRLLSRYGQRIRTPIAGLFLSGSAAEPMDVVSGRAARIAAAHANAYLARKNLT